MTFCVRPLFSMVVAFRPAWCRAPANLRAVPRQRQEGVAAIELSLTLVILLMLVFAIVGYGALFWVKQSMNAVAADTARHALLESYTAPGADLAAGTRIYACDTARRLAVLRAFSDLQAQGSCGDDFLQASLGSASACAVASTAGHRCLSIELHLAVDHWPLLNTMRQFAAVLTAAPQAWVPTDLTTSAAVLIAPPASFNP